ncbi:MAG: cysteine synthase A [Deltaproteobacteria bacterium]|nr:cysteine synthase A [Deltaproteobacteria bacterium]
MRRYCLDNVASVGGTPMVRLIRIFDPSKTLVLAKIEGRNPAFSVKDRIGYSMIKDAEEKGLVRSGIEIVEPTSGNTGISLAFVCALRGYPLTITMPETMSVERRKLIRILGANLVLTEGDKGMRGAVERAYAIVNSNPEKYFMPQQFKNPANPKIHEETTGWEIWEETEGAIDVLVSGVGTGGTITGISRFIKHRKGKKIHSVAVEPSESPVITQTLQGKEVIPGPHRIEGIGAGFVPDVLDLNIIDEVVTVSSDEAVTYARRLAREEGILAGISSGAAVAACARLVSRPEFLGKTVVTLLPSAAERYLTTALFEGLLDARTGL